MDRETEHSAADRAEPSAIPGPVACALCGTTEEGPPVTWSCSFEGGRRGYLCDGCVRAHLSSIEARLDAAWW